MGLDQRQSTTTTGLDWTRSTVSRSWPASHSELRYMHRVHLTNLICFADLSKTEWNQLWSQYLLICSKWSNHWRGRRQRVQGCITVLRQNLSPCGAIAWFVIAPVHPCYGEGFQSGRPKATDAIATSWTWMDDTTLLLSAASDTRATHSSFYWSRCSFYLNISRANTKEYTIFAKKIKYKTLVLVQRHDVSVDCCTVDSADNFVYLHHHHHQRVVFRP